MTTHTNVCVFVLHVDHRRQESREGHKIILDEVDVGWVTPYGREGGPHEEAANAPLLLPHKELSLTSAAPRRAGALAGGEMNCELCELWAVGWMPTVHVD